MASVRPLRELLADLVGDAGARAGGPEAYLAEHGHPDLPADLVAQAIVSFADTAPPEVAERLAPFVTAHTAGHEGADWFDLLTSAPAELAADPDELDGGTDPWPADFGADPGPGLDFGAGFDGAVDPTAELDEVPTATDWPPTVESELPDTAASSDTEMPELATENVAEDEEPDEDPLG
jgi:hypothetical protein